MSQHTPTLINLPPPQSNPDTPSEMPGTPTSTTTSLSALSTTAIKDGHRGHAQAPPFLGGSSRGHHHNPSTNSLEAERADRISRLAGLERVSTIRANQNAPGNANATSPQTTPTSTGFPAQQIAALPTAPAYFDSNGQPVQVTKISTVGTASATGSAGRTTSGTELDRDEDIMSMDTTTDRETEMDSVTGTVDPMDEDMASRSVGGFRDDEERMSDDGTASLVGFGEGANSTVSGPIYHRRPVPGVTGTFERSASGLSDAAQVRMRDVEGTPVSSSAAHERRDAMMMDGMSVGDGGHVGAADDETFVDTTASGPVPVRAGAQQQGAVRFGPSSTSREAAERIVRERLDGGESRVGSQTIGTAKAGDKLGQFYFEEGK